METVDASVAWIERPGVGDVLVGTFEGKEYDIARVDKDGHVIVTVCRPPACAVGIATHISLPFKKLFCRPDGDVHFEVKSGPTYIILTAAPDAKTHDPDPKTLTAHIVESHKDNVLIPRNTWCVNCISRRIVTLSAAPSLLAGTRRRSSTRRRRTATSTSSDSASRTAACAP